MPLNNLFTTQLKVINIGLQSFKQSLDAAGTPAIHVEWQPPAGGDPMMIEALRKLGRISTGARKMEGDPS
jgi:hypothetical protein